MYKKLSNCKFCNVSLADMQTSTRANHVRWCQLNPKRAEYAAAMDCSQMQTAGAIAARAKGIAKAHLDGKYDHIDHSSFGGWKHSQVTKDRMSVKALASPHRRLVRSIQEYTCVNGTIIKLDSLWEVALATRLDALKIKWVRPAPIKWIDSDNVTHNYFPDFYLLEHNLYLDPKGPYATKVQHKKIAMLTAQIPNLKFLFSLDECKLFAV